MLATPEEGGKLMCSDSNTVRVLTHTVWCVCTVQSWANALTLKEVFKWSATVRSHNRHESPLKNIPLSVELVLSPLFCFYGMNLQEIEKKQNMIRSTICVIRLCARSFCRWKPLDMKKNAPRDRPAGWTCRCFLCSYGARLHENWWDKPRHVCRCVWAILDK